MTAIIETCSNSSIETERTISQGFTIMKTLITLALTVILTIAAYPTVSNAYTNAIQEKAAITAQAKKHCVDSGNPKSWVKLKGSFEVYQCKDFII